MKPVTVYKAGQYAELAGHVFTIFLSVFGSVLITASAIGAVAILWALVTS